MKRILIISPLSAKGSGVWKLNNHPYIRKKAFIAPLGIAVLAGLTPARFAVDLWDENVHGAIDEHTRFSARYDLAAVTGYSVHFQRVLQIAAQFHVRNIPIVVGGPGVSTEPQKYRQAFDVLFIGEGELIWPRFLTDFEAGMHSDLYQETGHPDMRHSPAPVWGRLAAEMQDDYLLGAIQHSRGCPFRCEFCSNWKLFGNRMRIKEPVERVIDEIVALQKMGMREISFNVDNFAGHPKYTKQLLRKLIELNATLDQPLGFRCEISINIANDPEMLQLLTDANFSGLFIGIESPNPESLKEINKIHNMRADLVKSCHAIMSTGIPIDGSMIVGFDHDDLNIFDQQFNFLQRAFIPNPKMHLLKAIPGTDLWDRLVAEGRVLDLEKFNHSIGYADSEFVTNIIPRQISRVDLFGHYLELLHKLADWQHFAERVTGFISNIRQTGPLAARGRATGNMPPFLDALISSMRSADQHAISAMLAHVHRTQPALLPRVIVLLIRNHADQTHLAEVSEIISSQIRFEQALPKHDMDECIIRG